jgi:tetratricopeptide (TPR) repeat protein
VNDEALFVTAENQYPTMARLAGYFFRELQAFGALTSPGHPKEETVAKYISARSGFIHSFLQTLEMTCHLRFAPDAKIPFCYNTGEWNKAGPIAGYSSDAPSVLPSEVAASLTLNAMVRANGSLRHRLLKCGLWYLAENDLGKAIKYLFDLYMAGFTGYDDLFDVTAMILSGRSQAGSDQAFLLRVIGRLPEEVTDWIGLDLQPDLTGDNPPDADVKRVLSDLFEEASGDLERVRNAADLDQWIVGQALLGGLLHVVRRLINELIGKPPLPWRARLSQWEEIAADALGMMRVARAGIDALSPRIRMANARNVGEIIRAQVGDGWRERFHQERLLVPAQLREQFDAGTDFLMPPEWDHLSWRVIFPWTIGVEDRELPPAARVTPLSADELMDHAAARQVMATAGVSAPAQQRVVLSRYLNDGGSDRLMLALRQALPSDEGTLYRELLLADFDALSRLSDEGRYADAADRAARTIARYPWLGPAYQELAIALDRQGDPEHAVDPLLASIVLAPRSPFPWRSLAVVLNRMGGAGEARFADAFNQFLESEGRE